MSEEVMRQTVSRAASLQAARLDSHPGWLYRLGVGLALLMAGAASYAITAPFSAAAEMEPELLRLLRTMVLIKAGMGLAVVGLIFWRLGRPVSAASASGYTLGAMLLAVSSVWLWSLSNLPLATVLFYSSLIGIFFVARADETLFSGVHTRLGRRARTSKP
jgi:ABC-type enterochelin transport system permease subunit